MNYKSHVENSITNVIPTWFIIFFMFGIAIISLLLFPAKSLRYQILDVKQPQLISLYYLQKMVQMYPEEYSLRIALIQQEIGFHHWDVAKNQIAIIEKNSNLSVETRLMRYLLAYTQAFQLPATSSERTAVLQKISIDTQAFLNLPLSQNDILLLASNALSLNQPGVALQFYKKLGNIADTKILKHIAQTALLTSQYTLSAQYYMEAMQNEKTLENKRKDLIEALKTLRFGGLFDQAIQITRQLPDNIIDNKAMLLFLAQYMLSANRPDLAEAYIQKALQK